MTYSLQMSTGMLLEKSNKKSTHLNQMMKCQHNFYFHVIKVKTIFFSEWKNNVAMAAPDVYFSSPYTQPPTSSASIVLQVLKD